MAAMKNLKLRRCPSPNGLSSKSYDQKSDERFQTMQRFVQEQEAARKGCKRKRTEMHNYTAEIKTATGEHAVYSSGKERS